MANESISLQIKEHDFQAAKENLKKYSSSAQEEVSLSEVETDGGFLYLGDHKVTGSELNERLEAIQKYLINNQDFHIKVVDEFGQVYKAFEALDKDYIAQILAALSAAQKVSEDEQKDRADIKELVKKHEKIIRVLEKFKADIDSLKHITDVDKAWQMIQNQANAIQALIEYKNEFSQLIRGKTEELRSADEAQREAIDALRGSVDTALQAVQDQKNSLVQVSTDITKISNGQKELAASTDEKILNVQMALENQLAKRCEAIQTDIDALHGTVAENSEALKKQLDEFAENQSETLSSMQEEQAQVFEAQTRTLEQKAQEQAAAIEALNAAQSERLGQIEDTEAEKLEKLNSSLEEEKSKLSSTVDLLSQKIKICYTVAGAAAALTVLQFLLNIAGVI